MRYYAIKIDGAPANIFPPVPGAFVSGAQFCSVVNGKHDPGALDVQFDIPIGSDSAVNVVQGAFVKIRGISLPMISQAANLTNMPVSVYGGMSAGLPLANAQLGHLVNQGLLMKGTTQVVFGNWQGNETSLDFFFGHGVPGGGPSASAVKGGTGNPYLPKNHIWNWPKNTPMDSAIKNMLSTVYTGFNINVKVSPQLKLPYNDLGFYPSAKVVSQYLHSISMSILGKTIPNYKGVHVTFKGNNINVEDGTQAPISPAGQISYIDLVGQPTWIKAQTISFNVIMRSDLVCQQTVQMPQTVAVTGLDAAKSPGPASNPLTFQGKFKINHLRHVGQYRQPTGSDWITTVEAQTDGSGSGSGPKAAGGNTGGASGGHSIAG